MMKHDYCFAFCNRETRRQCRHECDKWKSDDPIEQSLLDIQCRFNLLGKTRGGSFAFPPLSERNEIDDMAMSERGRDCWLIWLAAIGVENIPYSNIDHLMWTLRRHKNFAVYNGIEHMLNAYKEGVPVEDIVA